MDQEDHSGGPIPPLEAEYPNVAFSPREPTAIPATEAVTMTRDGSSIVAFFCRSGANLKQYEKVDLGLAGIPSQIYDGA